MEEKFILSRPTVILGCGISASGKTVFLTQLMQRVYDTFWINKDVINKAFMKDAAGNIIDGGKITSPYYHKNVRNQSYDLMLDQAVINLRIGKHPVVEGNYNKQIQNGFMRNVIYKWFDSVNCDIKIVYCHAPEDVIYTRMKERNAPYNHYILQSIEAWNDFIKEQPILPPELEEYDHIKIDTTLPVEENIIEAVAYLKNE